MFNCDVVDIPLCVYVIGPALFFHINAAYGTTQEYNKRDRGSNCAHWQVLSRIGQLVEPMLPRRCHEGTVGGLWQRILNDALNQEGVAACAGRPYLKLSDLVIVIDHLKRLENDINWLSEMSNIKDDPFPDGHGWVADLGDTWRIVHGHLSELKFLLDLAIENGMVETRTTFGRAVNDHWATEVSIVAKFPEQVPYRKRDGCLPSFELVSPSNAKTDTATTFHPMWSLLVRGLLPVHEQNSLHIYCYP